MTKLFSTAAIALTILAAASAHAEGLTMVTTTLTYQSQDLANPVGAAKMLNRIELTARRLCAANSPVVVYPDAQSRACRAQAVARAVDALAAPMVTTAYVARQPAVAVASR